MKNCPVQPFFPIELPVAIRTRKPPEPSLHFQHGYFKPRLANMPWLIWGIVVDAVTISTVLWVITGIYIWARRPRKRLLGGLCLVAGSLLFAILALLMCG